MNRIDDNEWMLVRINTPKEIVQYINQVFEVFEIRRKIGEANGIKFIIHSNEKNHPIPHVHAQYGEFSISIAIEDQHVLAGNLPKKNVTIAQRWVRDNKERLKQEWDEYTISAISHFTKSRLSG